jgi:hypothetical protein
MEPDMFAHSCGFQVMKAQNGEKNCMPEPDVVLHLTHGAATSGNAIRRHSNEAK